MIKISPSILAVTYEPLDDAVKRTKSADFIHVDVMDGRFVPQTTQFLKPEITKRIDELTDTMLDVHLMVKEPEKYINDFASAGADIITFHYEATNKPLEIIGLIHDADRIAGIAINPATPLDKRVIDLMGEVDIVLLMSVVPGMCGQGYIDRVTRKITRTRDIINTKHLEALIEVDGGIKVANSYKPINAGADILVSGSGIYRPENDYDIIIRKMKDVILIGSDHGGIRLKERMKKYLNRSGHAYLDVGTYSDKSCDYPDFAAKVAKPISQGEFSRGILICGTGLGMSMAANKYPDVRAAIIYSNFASEMSKQHNDANIAIFGERSMDHEESVRNLAIWLKTPYSGDDRHTRRIRKIEII